MTFTLTPYQSAASKKVSSLLRYAATDFVEREQKKTAVGLTAPTGAGKTVMATDILERLRFGDAEHAPNPALTVLWVTDDPALNRQTRDKMLLASTRLTDGDFVEIDSGFDQKHLERGKVHFAHAQLFGRGTTSMQPSNSREHGLWRTVANTIDSSGSDFLLVIDEAHRGTGNGKSSREQATILSRLVHGGDSDHFTGHAQPPAPVVFGISATPERFKNAMDRAGRSLDTYAVPVDEVRESGLLKDRIVVRHPGENQPSEATLLALAVQQLRAVTAAWATHAEVTGTGTPVEPLLVVQVPPGIKDAEVGAILSALESEWSDLRGDAVRHAFDSHAKLYLPGDREVRYTAPDRIAGDPTARVVLFKNALTTGWDCPRAEVMLSLRAAQDYTNIAQLIGRMVRTPLAERIETDESLNAVTLFLPHYDKTQVAKVVAALGDDTGGDVDISIEPIECPRREDVPDEVWQLLAGLPSAVRIKKPWKSETDRLLGLARLLRGHDLLAKAGAKARARLIGAIKTEVGVWREEIDTLVADVTTLDMDETVWDHRRGTMVEDQAGEPVSVDAKVTDIDHQFRAACRVMPDATAKWYWNSLLDEDEDLDPYDAKAEVAALVKTPDMAAAFKKAVEKAATDQIETWRTTYANQVTRLPAQARRDFEAAWSPRAGTLTAEIEVPVSVAAATEKVTGSGEHRTTTPVPAYAGHLFAAQDHPKVADGMFPATLTSWEVDVLERETNRGGTLVGWYRNPARSKHGLAVAYAASSTGERDGLLYPDFLFFHQVDGETVVDVVDPHRHNEADTGPKWAGLARWAAEHRDKVRNVTGVIKVGDTLKALDLTGDGIAERLEECGGKDDIEALFEQIGSDY